MPAGEGGRLFLATRDQNFRVNPHRKKLYDEIEGEHLYRATRHFPDIKCSHGFRCTQCENDLRRKRGNEPTWRASHEWERDAVTGVVGLGKERMAEMIAFDYGGFERVNEIMQRELPRPKTTTPSTARRLKEMLNSRPVVDNELQRTLQTMASVKREYKAEEAAMYTSVMESAAVPDEVVVSVAADAGASTVDYDSMGRDDLMTLAQKKGLRVTKSMNKAAIVNLLRESEKNSSPVTNMDGGSESSEMGAPISMEDTVELPMESLSQ
jgi:hypothetical protein